MHCSPLLNYKDIKNGFLKLKSNKFKYIFAASNFSHPVERSFKVKNGKINMIFKKYFNITSKFFTQTYHEYWIFLLGKSRYLEKRFN